MKKLLILVGSILLLTTKLFAADPAVGLWKSIDDKTGKLIATGDDEQFYMADLQTQW